ncbi:MULTISPECIES: MerR family transcriptional regulator [Bacillus]|uniref:MerR family DNA-binding transcriptional regulator n=1 Tax=Bacillus TaxID=1386 RepID=UPI0009D7EBC7|nr:MULTISPECIES: MerR family transcriptional regulator [Bacillus]PEB97275.1 MerR family transcriptional regulator [Bacillus cereus]PEC24835.1 MerR family transcriptional regulator [Bacillus thuringiensis]PFZ16790.1 MerR family transcriptional regulator [Bacillus thuringiensis]PGA30123.1 MerR family transcriptional regulator [Bacillus thuringiensis]SMD34579.1 DNA-binding transcriptional regulator, MerR family [Bacillus sp. JKS001846]
METYSPKQIANVLNVSTTTLRRYEEQNLIPVVPRTESNHRFYTSIHFQAFITIRALLKGYDIPIVYKVMRMIKNVKFEEALWLINEQQFNVQVEKKRVEEILNMIQNADFTKYKNVELNERMSIGEAANIAGVNTSAIRHWEHEGLVHSERNKENGYRMFPISELRKILVISSLRKTVYYIENMKSLLDDLETLDYGKIERSFQLALENLNNQLLLQFKGIEELMKYIHFYE